jgi:hypothetical protein
MPCWISPFYSCSCRQLIKSSHFDLAGLPMNLPGLFRGWPLNG